MKKPRRNPGLFCLAHGTKNDPARQAFMYVRLTFAWLSEDLGVRTGQSFCAGLRQGPPRALLAALLIVSAFVIPPISWAQAAPAPRPSSGSIRTPDFDESVHWYRDRLGFRLIATKSLVPGRTAVLERSGFLLEISEADHVLPQAQEPDATGALAVTRNPVVSLLVPDVDEEIEHLRTAGVEVLQEPQDELDGGYRTAQIRDNGRHRIELREPLGDPGSFNPAGR
jgi:catechol 2,3-dioxygenase-like lactoylglutathione lyase family enzyme